MRHYIVFIAIVLCFSACRDKVICPAFQSTYILDDSVRSVYYSYLWKLDEEERLTYLAQQNSNNTEVLGDSAALGGPVIASTSEVDYFAYVAEFKVQEKDFKKTKFGMAGGYQPYWLKNYQMRTAPMENILAPPPPEPEIPEDTVTDVGEFVASDFNDSTASDSMAVAMNLDGQSDSTALAQEDTFSIPTFPPIAQMAPEKQKPETKWLYRYDPKDEMLNVEQQYYNKYFGDQLYVKVLENPKPPADSTATEEGGFFKRLFSFSFGKKDKAVADSLKTEETPPLLEEEPLEEDTEVEDGF